MKLSEKHKQILNFLADERDKNPSNGFVNIGVLEAKIGAYLSVEVNLLVRQLKLEGLVKRYGSKVMITEKGYRLVRSWHRRALGPIRSVYVATLEGITKGLKGH